MENTLSDRTSLGRLLSISFYYSKLKGCSLNRWSCFSVLAGTKGKALLRFKGALFCGVTEVLGLYSLWGYPAVVLL